MNNNYSPYGATPDYYHETDHFTTPTPSPRPTGYYYASTTPQRPATRAHFHHASHDYSTSRTAPFSPRYNSDGLYSTNSPATAHVSASRSTRKQSFSTARPVRERRSSYSYSRPLDSYGGTGVDEYGEVVDGVAYVVPTKSKSKRRSGTRDEGFHTTCYHDRAHRTDHQYPPQTSSRRPHDEHDRYYYFEESRRPSRPRRASQSQPSPQRPQTARPTTNHHKAAPPPTRVATEADAIKLGIPAGYSLKNWDPDEEPILLLGSVFDATSLGKWIYDWTVYSKGSSTPISEVAGELWLLLIQLAGNVKQAKETLPRIRTPDNKDMVDDFIVSGERLTDKLRGLLKACEKPMLNAASSSKRKDASLGQTSGIEFVNTMFGRERKLDKTEQFMQSVRLWILRFNANCEDVLKHPKQ